MPVVVRRVCFVIAEVMGPKYIKLPSTEEDVVKLASTFERKHGFPHCLGAVDGTHIHLQMQLTILIVKSLLDKCPSKM